jgi:hypothetical protein
MGSTLSTFKFHGKSGSKQQDCRLIITEEVVDAATEALREGVFGQDQAISILISWLVSLANNDKGSMRGSLCFVGPSGVGQSRCAKLIGKTIWGPSAHVACIDMRQYSFMHDSHHLFSALEEAQHSHIIVFDNIAHAQKSTIAIVDQVIRTRTLRPSDFSHFNFSNYASSSTDSGVLVFPEVLFIVMYTPYHTFRMHAGHSLVSQAKQTLTQLHSSGFAGVFDSYVSFKPLSKDTLRIIVRNELLKLCNTDVVDEELVDQVLLHVHNPKEGFKESVQSWFRNQPPLRVSTSPTVLKIPLSNPEGNHLLGKHKRKPESQSSRKKQKIDKHTDINFTNSNNTTTTTTTESNNPITETTESNNATTDSNNADSIVGNENSMSVGNNVNGTSHTLGDFSHSEPVSIVIQYFILK